MKLFTISFILIFFALHFNATGQKKKYIDQYGISIKDKRILSLLNSAKNYSKKNPQKSITYVESAIQLSIDRDNKLGLAYSYFLLGDINKNIKQNTVALNNYKKSEKLFINEKCYNGLYQCNRKLAVIYQAIGNSKK